MTNVTLVVAPSGAGKTTLCHKLGLQDGYPVFDVDWFGFRTEEMYTKSGSLCEWLMDWSCLKPLTDNLKGFFLVGVMDNWRAISAFGGDIWLLEVTPEELSARRAARGDPKRPHDKADVPAAKYDIDALNSRMHGSFQRIMPLDEFPAVAIAEGGRLWNTRYKKLLHAAQRAGPFASAYRHRHDIPLAPEPGEVD